LARRLKGPQGLLRFIRPTERLQQVLAWEGSLIDPVGGILGAVVFHAVLAGTHHGFGYQLGWFLVSISIGVAGAAVGVAVLWVCLRMLNLGEALGTSAQLACVAGVAAVCDAAREDAGLVAAVLTGLALANLRGFDVPARRPFFETLVQLIIGVLFISISATVTPASLRHLGWPTLGLVTVLVLLARPLAAFLATLRSNELAPGELLATATAGGAELEGITVILLLTDEDDFNALAAAVLAGNAQATVYRLAPRQPSHGVVAPYTGAETVFAPNLTRYDIAERHGAGARTITMPGNGSVPPGADLLFLVGPDGSLHPATTSQRLSPQAGDTLVLLTSDDRNAGACQTE